MDRTELNARIAFKRSALEKLRAAYLALLDGGVKSYTIDDRSLTRFDLPELKKEIDENERELDVLLSQLAGKKPRKSFGVIPREW